MIAMTCAIAGDMALAIRRVTDQLDAERIAIRDDLRLRYRDEFSAPLGDGEDLGLRYRYRLRVRDYGYDRQHLRRNDADRFTNPPLH